jgi:hypothetical protein
MEEPSRVMKDHYFDALFGCMLNFSGLVQLPEKQCDRFGSRIVDPGKPVLRDVAGAACPRPSHRTRRARALPRSKQDSGLLVATVDD